MIHISVLQKEVLEYLNPQTNENFIDCTLGGGGHTAAVLERNKPNGRVLGIDQSLELIQKLKTKNRLILVNDSFINLKDIVREYSFEPVHGILFDLGMSSWHLERSKKGFSFLRNEPLDMRYNHGNLLTAEKIINQWSESEIELILKEYGEEKNSKRIVREIIKKRPVKNTFQLVEIIEKAIPLKYRHNRIHFATRTFQALRIAVNDELENIKKVLPQAVEILRPKGRLVVISFHSLEDKIVKNFFREKAKENLIKILTKKPIRPLKEEIEINPRSRSGKLRAVKKI